MTVKDLIAKLQTLPPNMQIAVWDGYNYAARTKIKVSQVQFFKTYCTKKKAKELSEKYKTDWPESSGEWTLDDPKEFKPKDWPESSKKKTFLLLEPKDMPKINL